MKKTALIFLIFLSYCSILPAQEKDTAYKYWMTIGLMAHRDITFNFSYNFSLKNYFYKVGYFYRGGLSSEEGPDDEGYLLKSVDISIGKRLQYEWFKASFFIGPAFVFGKRRISHFDYGKFYTAGLETELQLLFRLANEVGIGVGFFANLNFVKNFYGINFNIALGNGK